jgi:hypothetical protein
MAKGTAIQAVLHKRLLKSRRPSKQAAWKVFVNREDSFLLTYLQKPSYC